MPNALARDGHARAFGGRARVSDPACPCCGGCPLWRRLFQCEPKPGDCQGPIEQRTLWICNSAVCESGEPISGGGVLLIDGFCFQIMGDTDPNPPIPLRIPPGPYRCLPNCAAPECGLGGTLFYPARLCAGDFGSIWVCGPPAGCTIKGCFVIDASQPGSRFEDIPQVPPPTILRYQDIPGPVVQNCCDGQCSGQCRHVNLQEPQPPNPPTRCCCEVDQNGEPTTRQIVTVYRTSQVLIDTSGDPSANGRIDLFATDACANQVHLHREGFGQPILDLDGIGRDLVSCPQACPGNLSYGFRLTDINNQQAIVGQAGRVWSNFCEGYPPQPNGEQLTVSCASNYTCRAVSETSTHQYSVPSSYQGTPGIQTIRTTFAYAAQIVGPNRCTDCGGDGVIGGGIPFPIEDGPPDFPPEDFRRLIVPAS